MTREDKRTSINALEEACVARSSHTLFLFVTTLAVQLNTSRLANSKYESQMFQLLYNGNDEDYCIVVEMFGFRILS